MNHSVEFDGKQGAIHSHTWEICTSISVKDEEFVLFSDVEKCVAELLEKYQDKYINEIEPFDKMNPTLENVCDYLYEFLTEELKKKGWNLFLMEMSETPSRIYQVSG